MLKLNLLKQNMLNALAENEVAKPDNARTKGVKARMDETNHTKKKRRETSKHFTKLKPVAWFR